MEDRWPYPVSQAMQRQTGCGHKAARPVPADATTERHPGISADRPVIAAPVRSNACQSERQSKD
jgi:hypothetical protein